MRSSHVVPFSHHKRDDPLVPVSLPGQPEGILLVRGGGNGQDLPETQVEVAEQGEVVGEVAQERATEGRSGQVEVEVAGLVEAQEAPKEAPEEAEEVVVVIVNVVVR